MPLKCGFSSSFENFYTQLPYGNEEALMIDVRKKLPLVSAIPAGPVHYDVDPKLPPYRRSIATWLSTVTLFQIRYRKAGEFCPLSST